LTFHLNLPKVAETLNTSNLIYTIIIYLMIGDKMTSEVDFWPYFIWSSDVWPY